MELTIEIFNKQQLLFSDIYGLINDISVLEIDIFSKILILSDIILTKVLPFWFIEFKKSYTTFSDLK